MNNGDNSMEAKIKQVYAQMKLICDHRFLKTWEIYTFLKSINANIKDYEKHCPGFIIRGNSKDGSLKYRDSLQKLPKSGYFFVLVNCKPYNVYTSDQNGYLKRRGNTRKGNQ